MKKLLIVLLFFYTSLCLAAPKTSATLTVLLDSSPNPTHAPLVIAQQLNYFKQAGLNVKLISPGKKPLKANISVQHQPQFMQEMDKHPNAIVVGVLIDKPLSCLIALQGDGIKRIGDLKGKRFALTDDKLTLAMLTTMLNKIGLSDKDITILTQQDHLNQTLLSHQADVIGSMQRNIEAPLLELNNHKVVVFFPEEHGVPTYNELIFVADKSHLHDKRFAAFLLALKQAVRYLDEHPQQAWQVFTKAYPQANTEVNREAWFATLPYFAEDPANIDTANWQRFATFMQHYLLIKKMQRISAC